MELTDVSKTAIVTLRCHALETRKAMPLIRDRMAEYCLGRLESMASSPQALQLFHRPLAASLVNHIVLRARKYDSLTNEYIAAHPGCVVVNLGCGFDTRYWRINHDQCQYMELDLRHVVAMKRQVLGNELEYPLIGGSVLDHPWLDMVLAMGAPHVLLLAEGLLLYLPKPQVLELFRILAGRLQQSQIVLEVVTQAYTRGLWKKVVEMKMRSQMGLNSGSAYDFGIRNARELETYAPGIRVIGEWSYVEDPDLHPRIHRYLGIARTQWTVVAAIN
jgi:methyltransferase (TIGR00027 family)